MTYSTDSLEEAREKAIEFSKEEQSSQIYIQGLYIGNSKYYVTSGVPYTKRELGILFETYSFGLKN